MSEALSIPAWEQLLNRLEAGTLRAAYQDDQGQWHANTEVKAGILSVFPAGEMVSFEPDFPGAVDKHNLAPRRFRPQDQVRQVPGGSSVRRGAYVAPGVVIMPPAYINIGAFVDSGTMVDSHALVGSCAQIGKQVHLSAGVQIGGVLEPVGMAPVIVEDHAFIGAGCVLVEGVIVKRGAVLAPGVQLSASVPVYDLVNECQLAKGAPIPENAVVVPGSRPASSEWGRKMGLTVQCPVIIKYRDAGSDAALALEEALR